MAPIPDDNQERPPPDDSSDLNSFSNINVTTLNMDSDFSDDENEENYPDTAGYMLLPQEPGNEEDSDSDIENDPVISDCVASTREGSAPLEHGTVNSTANGGNKSGCDTAISDQLPDEVLQSEAAASGPTVTGSSVSLHPEFLAKFPDGKVPSYMQVPAIPPSSKESMWNKRRTEKNVLALDSAQESKILRAMSGFSLPIENVPDWARNMSEEQWNQHIVQQITPGQNKPEAESQSEREKHQPETDVPDDQRPATDNTWVAEFPDS